MELALKKIKRLKLTDLERLKAPEELELLRVMREFPATLEMSAASLEPFGLITYLQSLAESLHRFYDKHRVLSDDEQQTLGRLALVQGVQTVLANGLGILGVSAPQKM